MNGYLIDSNQRIVYYDTSEIQLTNKEFDLLSYFVKNKNNLVSRDQILFQFRSLTMRIWTTFTVIILVIILGISFIYLVIFRRINNEAKMNDLKVAHDMIVESDNIYEPNRLNELHNLMQSRHFIVEKYDKSVNIVPIQNKILMPDKGIEDKAPVNKSLTDKSFANKEMHYDMPFSKERSLHQWMCSFANSRNLNDTKYQKRFNGKMYNFIISYVKKDKGRSIYLISYSPESKDNRLIYYEIVIGLIFIIIDFITSNTVASSIAKPLKKLEDYTVKIAKKEWETPIEISSKDEIGRLAESMNKMQIELRRADEEEKMFLQSISHDLKTPVNDIFDNQYKDKSGNFGLGLAISKKVINFYRGVVYAQNEDVGVTFVIKIKR
ncbi:HAMP domain-containing protein [Inconstantimicrobium porci]|uniref:HAMP domain-containing protein n=1 Tax=Inconstantimicrobium porci TaxID=2652291 RepID=UPI002E266E35